MSGLDDLFNGNISNKLVFESEKKERKGPLVYKVDMKKFSAEGSWKSVVRFLPNVFKNSEGEYEIGKSMFEKTSHYVDIKEPRELSGYFDSPRNFNESCPLSSLYSTLDKSDNVIMKERAKQLNLNRNNYAYVLVVEDNQQPELVGKIMVYQFPKQISDMIRVENTGEITGDSCDVFDIANGKDFVILASLTKDPSGRTFPNYKNTAFRPQRTSLPMFKDGELKRLPTVDRGDTDSNGIPMKKVDPNYTTMALEYLMNREVELATFEPKRLSDADHEKINQIVNHLTGKASTSFANANSNSASLNDFTSDVETFVNSSNDFSTSSSSGDDEFFDF